MNNKDQEVHKAIAERFKKEFKKLGKEWKSLEHDERFSSASYSDSVENRKESAISADNVNDEGLQEPDLSDEQVRRLEAIKKAPLTRQQRMIVYLCGERGLSMEQAAITLRIKKGSLQTQLENARKKIEKTYEELPYE